MTETTVMTKQEANAELSDILKRVESLMTTAENLADEYGLTFTSPIGAYGMGGDFYGKGSKEFPSEDWYPSTDDGWRSSSASC